MSKSFEIDGRRIGLNESPYIIAEMSANHNGSIENAFKIIEMAKKAGADAVKLQSYTPDTITINMNTSDFMIRGGLWDGQSLYDLYQSAFMPWEWHKPLFDHAKKNQITIFSTPFDLSAVDLLEDLNCPAYKIASFELIDLPLIDYVASTGKPMIMSTGMADEEEISESIDAALSGGCKDLALLHCVSGYPAPAEDYNLKTIVDMRNRFGLVTGISDHTIDNFTSISSVSLGVSIIEKHVTLNREGGGPDDSFSLEFDELCELCNGADIAWRAQGKIDYGRKSSESGNAKFRRSLYFVKSIKKGEIITRDHVKSIRPGFGLPPKHLNEIVGKKVNENILKGSPVDWELVVK